MPASRTRFLAMVVAMTMAVAGCSGTMSAEVPASGGQSEQASVEVRKPLELKLTPAPESTDVAPGEPVRVKASNGKLSSVKLIGVDGTVVKGGLNKAKTSWSSAEPLGYGKEYTLTARGVGEDGEKRSERSTFTTISPAQQVGVQVAVPDGATVGVGMPISFSFTGPVADKEAVERMLEIRTSKETEGAFHWFSDTWVVWRPKEYWKPGTRVDIDAKIYGRDLGNGLYGLQDQSRSMKIGKKVVAVADGKKHQMTVKVGDRKPKKMPISMGKPTHPTPEGIYTVMSEHRPYTMDSSTYGVPTDAAEGYKITVTHATRMSYSGIFYHSAPWSVYAQGNSNVSHGCINLSTENADWLMKQSKPGDIIKVTNSGGQKLEPTDGWSFWQMSWDKWSSGGKR